MTGYGIGSQFGCPLTCSCGIIRISLQRQHGGIMIKLWRAHRAERRAQRAYLYALARTDVSPLDMHDWTPGRLDRLAAELWPDLPTGDDDARL